MNFSDIVFLVLLIGGGLAYVWFLEIPTWWMMPYKKKLRRLEWWLVDDKSREALEGMRDSLRVLRDEVASATLWHGFRDVNHEQRRCIDEIDDGVRRVSNKINEIDVAERLDEISPLLDTDPVDYVREVMGFCLQGWASHRMVKDMLRAAVGDQLMPLVYRGDQEAIDALNEWLIYQDE